MMRNQNILVQIYHDFFLIGQTYSGLLLQTAAIAVVFVAAFWISSLLKKKIIPKQQIFRQANTTTPGSQTTVDCSASHFSHVLFPLLAYCFIQLSQAVLTNWITSLNLLNLVSALLFAFVNIRFFAYLLQRIWHPSKQVVHIEKYLAIPIFLVFILYIVGALPKTVDALSSVNFYIGKNPISLFLIFQALISIAVTLLLALWIGKEIERYLMQHTQMGPNAKVMLVKLTWSLLAIIAVLVVLSLLGIDPTLLSVLGGAFGVGLGLSLQTVASNYISGFIILLDKSVKIDDLIQLGSYKGRVTELTSRYVVLKGLDGTEALIPNQTMMTSIVTNYSYTDKQVWTSLSFLIAYDTDLVLAMKLMLETLSGKPRIAVTPEPRVFLKSFCENGINLELGFWLTDPENGSGLLCSEINLEVWQAFKNNQINMPFPQRDVRILNAEGL